MRRERERARGATRERKKNIEIEVKQLQKVNHHTHNTHTHTFDAVTLKLNGKTSRIIIQQPRAIKHAFKSANQAENEEKKINPKCRNTNNNGMGWDGLGMIWKRERQRLKK